ncbi:hypothetical protein CLF_108745 [Clonorchis sinensis]|uniref:Uncharacterized protein n=1 Tax=Clonorchis sinensis TaxID=79923 RepID=G7YIG7_CLOSI|nr:hypothetical protein CLF_108745 [Clonorchis sinensis]
MPIFRHPSIVRSDTTLQAYRPIGVRGRITTIVSRYFYSRSQEAWKGAYLRIPLTIRTCVSLALIGIGYGPLARSTPGGCCTAAEQRVEDCYKNNPGRPLQCSQLVKEYIRCVNNFRVVCVTTLLRILVDAKDFSQLTQLAKILLMTWVLSIV